MMKRKTLLLLILILLSLSPLHVFGEDSSGTAVVGNIAPVVSDLAVSTLRSDDGFQVTFSVNDNNTLGDLTNLELIMWHSSSSEGAGDDATNHYTFSCSTNTWQEEPVSGHLVVGTSPASLSGANGDYTVNVTFAPASLVGTWTLKVTATDGATSHSLSSSIVRDRLKIADYRRDVANERLYVKLVYESDDTDIHIGTVNFANYVGSTNSTGWATIPLDSMIDFDWNTIAYAGQDNLYKITETGLNATIPLAKATRIIGGNMTLLSASYADKKLDLVFNETSGKDGFTEISPPRPVYLLNVTYDLLTEYTDKLTINHDGNRKLRVGYPSWGSLEVRGTESPLSSVSIASEILTIRLNDTIGASSLIYVDCTGLGGTGIPQEVTGADPSWYMPSSYLWWGNINFTSTIQTLVLDFRTASGGGGGGGGGGSVVDVRIDPMNLEFKQGQPFTFSVPVVWTGTPSVTVQSISFGSYKDWFSIDNSLPKHFVPATNNADRNGVVNVTVTATGSGTHTIPIELTLTTSGYATVVTNGYIYATIERGGVVIPGPIDPTQGSPIPNIIGIAIGVVFVGSLAWIVVKRK